MTDETAGEIWDWYEEEEFEQRDSVMDTLYFGDDPIVHLNTTRLWAYRELVKE